MKEVLGAIVVIACLFRGGHGVEVGLVRIEFVVLMW